MFFQGRGNTYLQAIDANGVLGPAIKICQDAISIALATDSFEHINKCGLVDVPDYRGTKSVSGTVTLEYSDVDDKRFAIGVLGTVTPAAAADTATNETLPDDLVAGDSYFLGGATRHRAITALTIQDSTGVPLTLVAGTDYALDAPSGRIDIIDPTGFVQPFIATTYGFTDPASVSMLSAPQREYFLSYENINKANDNDPGAVELYKVRFDPAANLDFLSEELQSMSLTGTVLADTNRSVTDTEFGQFGRRIL